MASTRTTKTTATLRAALSLASALRSTESLIPTTRSAKSTTSLAAAAGTAEFLSALATLTAARTAKLLASWSAGSPELAARRTGFGFIGGQLTIVVAIEFLQKIAGRRFDLGSINCEVVVHINRGSHWVGWGTPTSAAATKLTTALAAELSALTAAWATEASITLVAAAWSAKTTLLRLERRDRQGEGGGRNCKREFHGFDRVIDVCVAECEFKLPPVCKAGRR